MQYLTKKAQSPMRHMLTIGIILIITIVVVIAIYYNIKQGSMDTTNNIISQITGWG